MRYSCDISTAVLIVNGAVYTGWPQKVSYFQVSSLKRIKTVIKATFFTNFDYKMSTSL